jgi:DNA-binding transcriptional LysR family regulator
LQETILISSDMLSTFVKVAETLNVTRSAQALGVGKSVVSKRVAQLEEHVGATLFSRSTRRIALTAAGEAYLEHARRALAEMSAGEERLLAMRSDLKGRIRVTAPVSWGQRVLCRLLPEFLRLHPGIELELVLADRVMDIAYERMDVALRWSTAQVTQELHATPLAGVDWLLAASPAYVAAAGEPQDPDELAARPCLFYWREPVDDRWSLTSGRLRREVRVRSRYHVDNPEAVLEACVQGLGVGLLPGYLCNDALAAGQLARVLPGWTPQTRFGTLITALVPPERMRLPRNRALVDFLRQTLSSGRA